MDEHPTLYFECHITIEPVFEEKLELFKKLCSSQKFHVAKLLMEKRKSKEFKISNHDTFCTSRDQDHDDLIKRMLLLIDSLKENQFEVRRYKTEAALIDSRKIDVYCRL